MYKGKRYNIIVACLLLVISLVVGSSMGMAFNSSPAQIPNLDNEDTAPPVFEDLDPSQTFNGLKQPSASASAQKRLEFGLAVLNYGKGYTSESIYNIDVLGNNQYFLIRKYRSGNYNLVEEWYKMTGMLGDVGLNYFIGAVQTPAGIKQIIVADTKYYNFDQRTYDTSAPTSVATVTPAQYTESKYGVPINDFFAPINSTDSPVIYDNKGRGTSYYEIKVKLNGEKLKPQFFGAFAEHGTVSVEIEEMTCTFKIDKNTGFFISYEVAATFKASAYGLTGRAKFSIKENFSTMNSPALNKIKPIAEAKFGISI